MAGPDPKDTTCADIPVPDYEAAVGKSVKGLRIGIPKEYRLDGMPAEIEKIWEKGREWLKAAGAELVDVSLPHTKYALPAYYIVAPAEASSNLARYDGVRYGLREPAREIIDMLFTFDSLHHLNCHSNFIPKITPVRTTVFGQQVAIRRALRHDGGDKKGIAMTSLEMASGGAEPANAEDCFGLGMPPSAVATLRQAAAEAT